ncbi:MAG: hypothetical protein EON51_16050 [Acinetobacter sp.]|nr:MAG: hypothetical protein EON51_16050 [Acinetobacter sp.]
MKKLLYSCTLLTMWVLTAKAQPATQQQIKPEFSPAGVYVKTGVIPARGETVIISRDMGKGFEVIGNLTAPENQAVLYQRMQGNSLRLPNYYSVTEQLAGTLWQLLQAGKKDSILHANIPVMLMGLGAAYLDTTKNLPEATRYQVQLGTQSWESGPLGKRSAPVKNYNFFSLAPAAQVIRAQWRVQVTQRPPLFEIQRKKLGIDSNFTKLKTDLGFEKTKRGDSLSVHLSDTTVLPGISYSYVLTGKDFLGRIIGVSDTIRSIAGNRTSVNGIDRFTTKTAPDSTGIMLQWNRQNPNAIRSIRILRSAYYDSTYVQVAIVTPTDTTWTDRSAAMGANYYYQVIAQGNGDFAYPSPRVFGSFMNKQRMLAPSALASQKSEAGIKLNWKYGTYMNLLGFRMYRALGNSGKFMPISDVLTATRDSLSFSFVDRDKSLIAGEFYTYAVAAIGRNYVESPLSAIAQVNYVEKTRLQAPTQLRALMVNDSTVSITWQDLSMPGNTWFKLSIKVIAVISVCQPLSVARQAGPCPRERSSFLQKKIALSLIGMAH